MATAKQVINYRPIKKGWYYEIWVTELIDNGHYRVELIEEYDPHTTQIVDLRLNHECDRRWLEDYISDLLKRIHIGGVWFGAWGCSRLDSLDVYVERNPQTSRFLNDLHINLYS